MSWRHWLPCLQWARRYDRASAAQDGLAALIVTLMLIPQSLAYAMLAGLPPVTGLYASIVPLLAYALFGSSRTLPAGNSGARVAAVISETTATGPTASTRLVPSSAYMNNGATLAYSPTSGGSPASIA